MAAYVVRVWVPDRPGALGAVASRIGAVRGDLVGIDILERGAGRAIDELVVELPHAELVPLLIQEIHEVDGVDVEEVREVGSDGRPDPRVAALETAAALVEQQAAGRVLDVLVDRAVAEYDAAWAAVTDVDANAVVASSGDAPPDAWVVAFTAGVGAESAEGAAGDVGYAPLANASLMLVVGRPGRPLRAMECRQLSALARVADARWIELGRRTALSVHPSAV